MKEETKDLIKILLIPLALILGLIIWGLPGNAQTCTSDEIKQDVNTPVPKGLEDAEIIVRTKDGKEHKMSANDFKVVKRKQQFKVKERVVYQTVSQPDNQLQVVEKRAADVKPNIVSITVNRSLTDYDLSSSGPGSFRIENRYKPAVGLMYQRNVYQDFYLGVQADTHKSVGANLGVGF